MRSLWYGDNVMAKIVLLLAIIVVAALLVRKVMRFTSSQRRGAEVANEPADVPAGTPEVKLVRCVECGAFVPKNDALPAPTGFRCGGAGCAKPH